MLNISRFLALLALFSLTGCVISTVPRGAPPVNPPETGYRLTGGIVEVELVDVNGTRLSSNTHRCDVYVGIPNALGWQYAFGSFTPNVKTFRLNRHQFEIVRSETRLVATFEVTQSYGRRYDQREFTVWKSPGANYAEMQVRLPAWCRKPLNRGSYNPYDQQLIDGKFPHERTGRRRYP